MRPRSTVVAVAVVATLVLGAGVPAAAAAAGTPQSADDDPLHADATVVEVDLLENGTAAWTVQYKYRLHTDNRSAAFERLRSSVEGDREYDADVRRDYRAAARVASNDTDREMTVRDVSVDASRQRIPQDTGVVVHEFVWDGFAATDGARVLVGDAISGLWLRSDSRFTVRWPASYEATAVDPTPGDTGERAATWESPAFGPDQPQVVLERDSSPDAGLVLPGAALFAVLCALAAVRYAPDLPDGVPRPAHADVAVRAADGGRAASGTVVDGSGSDGVVDDGAGHDDGSAHDGGSARDDGSAHDGGAGHDGGEASDDEEETPPLTNEEQLRHVLDRNDGRVRQQEVADACGWSDSKTSRVVRSLEGEGAVEVFRIGRENVVSYPEVDVTDD